MKKSLLYSLFAVAFTLPTTANAQPACTKTIYNCNANLTEEQFADSNITIIINKPYAKPSALDIAPDASYASDCPETSACSKNGASLIVDIYFPKASVHNYNTCALPAIFLIHPGGFSDCSNKDQGGMAVYAAEFAKRGFVVFNVEYRRGHLLDPNAAYKSASNILSMYHAFQDLRGAIRSAIQMQQDGSFSNFKFDTAFIFLGGAGTTLMNTAYYNQKMMDEIMPGAKQALGPVNADYYYGDTALKFTIKGVLNLWGSMIATLKKSFLNYFLQQKETMAPLISFHGVLDTYSHYNEELIRFSQWPYNRDSICLLTGANTFVLKDDNGASPDLKTYGSQNIYDYFVKTFKIPAELYLDCHMHHGLDDNTGFGTGTTDIPEVQKYIVQRAVTFFQAVVNIRASQLNTTRFVDCENFRFGCAARNNNNACSNKDSCASLAAAKGFDQGKGILFTIYKTNNNSLSIHFASAGKRNISIYTFNGELVKSFNTQKAAEDISLPSSSEEIYFIKIREDDTEVSKTIML